MTSEHSKKNGFLGHASRFFTRKDREVYADSHFQEPEDIGDESSPALECPDTWSAESASVLADALGHSIPSRTRAIEENTVPSWLWRRAGQGAGRSEETSAKQIFDRVTGSAVYSGWKQGLFFSENEARIFFDEVRALLMQRLLVFEPHVLASLGLEWAYGLNDDTSKGQQQVRKPASTRIDIPNAMIDAMVSGVVGTAAGKNTQAKRQKLWSKKTEGDNIVLRLSDIANDWGTSPLPGVRATLDLMGFRHNDGWVNINALRHAVRLAVIFMDLHGDRLGARLDIGFCNLAPLLMALALPYDSNNGRAMAAALSAVITAEAYATSAELAALRGPGTDYTNDREAALRILRNHRRAAYGDRNDYEKISVLPVPLLLEHSPDLAMVAIAQRRWEDALALARQHGLRHTQVTSLTLSPIIAMFMESASQGIEPITFLTRPRSVGADLFQQESDPSIVEALSRLGYSQAAIRSIICHISGTGTLEKAPGVNHTSMHGCGFNDAAIARVEEYLRYVTDIRLAFTPWVVGEDYCRTTLKIPAAKLSDPRFDLLKHLGFSAVNIEAANAYCYGHGSVQGAHEIRQQHVPVFAHAKEISVDARVRMAAAVQGFISGDAGLSLVLPLGNSVDKNEALLLSAWRQGIKSLTFQYSSTMAITKAKSEARQSTKKAEKKIRPSVFLHTKQPAPLPKRHIQSRAGTGLVSLARSKGKSSTTTKSK